MALLLDTCAVIWGAQGASMSQEAVDAMNMANQSGEPIFISPISSWELGILTAKGRLKISSETWLEDMLQTGMAWAQMPPEVLFKSSFLPGDLHNDPADRIIIATAREYNMQIVTRDRQILSYADKGYVKAMVC